MRAILVGLGAVGARSARQLLSSKSITEIVVFSRHPAKAEARLAALGGAGALSLQLLSLAAFSEALGGTSVTLLAAPGPCLWAETSLKAGVPVVSTSDDPHETRSLLGLRRRSQAGRRARRRRRRHGPGAVVPAGGVGGITGR